MTYTKVENKECLYQDGKYNCSNLFNCCDCGKTNSDFQCCMYCFSCNACENCLNADND